MLLEFGALDLMCLHAHTYMHQHTHLHTHIHECVHMHAHAQTCRYMCVCAHIHACVHRTGTYKHARRHADTPTPVTHLLPRAAAQGTLRAWCAHLVVNLCPLKRAFLPTGTSGVSLGLMDGTAKLSKTATCVYYGDECGPARFWLV